MTPVLILAAALMAPAPSQNFSIRSGSTLDGVNQVAAQAGIDVVVVADLRGRTTSGLTGRMTADAALDRLLRPAGARAVRLGDRLYRIEPAPVARAPRPAPPPPPPSAEFETIIVTAPVRRGGLADATGRSRLSPAGLDRADGVASSDAVADLSATIDSTRQGPGRNKLFVRGLADSAFNGPLQSTIGQYLGDLRLNYGSPDPDLALIDVQSIDVFEGPQGARFGAGSIGGVIRLQPRAPSLDESSIWASVGASATSGGSPGGDAALVVNRPLGQDAALRLVAYGRRDGGFLDNPVRGVDDADHVETQGGRASVRVVSNGWTIDLHGLVQQIRAGDAQTVVAQDRRMAKTRQVAEPYESGLGLVGITATRQFGQVRLTSATSLSRQTLDERFDATGPGDQQPSIVDRNQSIWAFSSELRVETDPDARWAWVGGAAVATGKTHAQRRRLDLADTYVLAVGSDLDRTFTEAAAFGETVWRPTPDLKLSVGGRLSSVRIVYTARSVYPDAVAGRLDPDGTSLDFTPSVAARWTSPFGADVFARVDRAIRPGGVSETDGGVQPFISDRVTLFEIGIRSPADHAVSAEISWGLLDWRDIQADVATQGGDLVTGNVGDGRIRFISAKAAWRPLPRLELSGGLFLNDSLVRIDRPSIIGVTRAEIPNVAPVGAQFSLDHDAGRLAGLPLRLGVDMRYVGRSRLGLGPGLDVPQGGYLRTELSARLGDERRAATLRISNPLDVQATRYGIGSPYQLYDPQAVPVRPLTVRLGFEAAF